MNALFTGKRYDRVPIFPIHHYASARLTGVTIKQYAQNPRMMADAVIASAKRFGYDALMTGSDVTVEGEACGSEIIQPEEATAYVVKPVIDEFKALDRLEIPNPKKAGRMPVTIEATAICKEEVGDEYYISAPVMGPFNAASQLRGVENIMMDFFDEPEFVERLLDFATDVSIAYACALIDAGADMIQAGEALCSPGMISPSIYRNYVLPRHRRWSEALFKHGAKSVLIHVCGDITPILGDLGRSGASALDIDYAVPLKTAREKSGLIVRGNLDPASVLLYGTPALVAEKTREILDDAKEGRGIIISSGCDVSPDTPFENLDAMVKAAVQYGQYD